jgi:hypothetical protein
MKPRARLLLLLALALLTVSAPGVRPSWFAGAPLSTYGIAAFAFVLCLAVIAGIVRPLRTPRPFFFFGVVVILLIKIALAFNTTPLGWRGYYTGIYPTPEGERSLQGSFFSGASRQPFRVDREIDFSGPDFGLHFLNEALPYGSLPGGAGRDHEYPLMVRWVGYVTVSEPRNVTARLSQVNGMAAISIDGRRIGSSLNPTSFTLRLPPGTHEITVDYQKPAATWPALSLALPLEVTTEALGAGELSASKRAAATTSFLGLLLVILAAGAVFQAYRPIRMLIRERLQTDPSRVALIVVVFFFIALGVWQSIPSRHGTVYLSEGNDPLAYESQARNVMSSGLLMNAPGHFGSTAPFYFYPFYSYYLAGFHLSMGEDFSSVIFANWVCLALTVILAWLLVFRHLPYPAATLSLLLTAAFVLVEARPYAALSFTDNLYLPMVVLAVFCLERAVAIRKRRLFFLLGVVAAIAAATRPSFLLFPPVIAAALILWRRLGPRRFSEAGSMILGFLIGVLPFTLRNWIVAKKFVLLVESFVMLPYFLFSPEEEKPNLMADGPPGLFDSLETSIRLIGEAPAHHLWVEARKILFTMGFTGFGPHGAPESPRWFFILPLLFLAAILLRKVPFPAMFSILGFGAAHLVAMVLAAPWTYGHKTILPLHAVMLIGAAWLLRPSFNRERVKSEPPIEPAIPERPRVSVILPTYNEKDSIRQVIQEFWATGQVDEIIVINNNAADGTSEEVSGTGAGEVLEPRQGYGSAIRRGLREASGDYIVVCEPDGTFLARDITKLLSYAEDFDVVYGSRTSQQLVWRGANMGFFLRWGNYAVAKYLELLYNATSLTDVGCTMRLIRKDVADRLQPHFRIDGSQFGPEMMIMSLRAGYRIIQVPVNYLPRVGESSVTGDPLKAFVLGIQMIWLITSRRFQRFTQSPRPDSEPHSEVAAS